MTKKFVVSVLFVIVLCVAASVALGVYSFYANSLQADKAPYDLQGPAAIAAIVPSVFAIVLAAISVYFFIFIEDPVRNEALELKKRGHLLANQLQAMVAALAVGRTTGREDLAVHGLEISAKALEDFVLNSRGMNVLSMSGDEKKTREHALLYINSWMMLTVFAKDAKVSLGAFKSIKEIIHDLKRLDDISSTIDKIQRLSQIDFESDNIDVLIASQGTSSPKG